MYRTDIAHAQINSQQFIHVMAGFGNDMDHLSFDLQLAYHHQHLRLQDHLSEYFESLAPDHQIGITGFIFNRAKQHPFGRTGTLPYRDQPAYLYQRTILQLSQFTARGDMQRIQLLPGKTDRMRLQ